MAHNILVLQMLPLQKLVVDYPFLTVPVLPQLSSLKGAAGVKGCCSGLLFSAGLSNRRLVTRLLEFFSSSGSLQNPLLFGVMILTLAATIALARFSPPGKAL